MDFDAILTQILHLLQREGRVSYRALKRRFDLDDEYLNDLKDEIIQAKRLAIDEDGNVLVWMGNATTVSEAVHDQGIAPEAVAADLPTPETERRQLTVMFCDLVGSTALSAQLEPEDLYEVIQAYQVTCAEVVQRFNGHIAQHLGDGLLVYFGYPQAHEDDAQRAVHAGLDMVEAIETLNGRLMQEWGIQLAVRIGLHTGLVIVGEVGSRTRVEQLALGEVPIVADRLQNLARPNSVVISPSTLRIVEGMFACQSLGKHALKGIAQPMAVYLVSGISEAQNRFDVAMTTGLGPLVGRGKELSRLLHLWQQVQQGAVRAVLLQGEAGIGKSRLVHELQETVQQAGGRRLLFRCAPYYQHSALYPVIAHLQQLLQFRREESPPDKLDKLEQFLETYHFSSQEVVSLFAALLSLPADRYPPLNLSPQRQRQKTQEALFDWLAEETEQQPVLMIWEDLHWVDPSSLELIGHFVHCPSVLPLFVVLTGRPDFQPPWTDGASLSQITLTRLERPQIELMLKQIAAAKGLPAEVVQHVVDRTDGVPLFVEEIIKMVLESGLLRKVEDQYELIEPFPALAIPSTLRDSLMSRLDRLTTGKQVAHLGAALDREFSYELIQAVWPEDEAALQSGLEQLLAAGLLYRQRMGTQTLYVFKHALIQDTAYQSLVRSRRQQYHRQIARVLEEQFRDLTDSQPELLAHHYTEANLREQAIGFWLKAGQRAIQGSAHVEAIGHLTKGLEILETLPDTPERRQYELTLNITLGAPLLATRGYAAAEVGKVFTRARELCYAMGDTPQLFGVLQGLWGFHCVRAELRTALEFGKQLVHLAQRLQDHALLLEATGRLGISLSLLGELEPARQYLEQGVGLYDPTQHHAHAFLYGQDPKVAYLCHAAWVLWLLGYPDQALQRSQEALELARELSHPFSLAWAHLYAALTHMLRQEWAAAQAQAEALITLGGEQRFAYRLAQGRILQGWTLVQQGQDAGAIDQMQKSLDIVRATGAEVYRPYFQALLAKAHGKVGQPAEGLIVLTEVLAIIDKTDERFYAAGLHRLKGDLLLAQADDNRIEAEVCFQKALDIARHQQAKSLELQAAISLGRLWQRQGRQAQARHLLADVYNRFTEGWETADLREARTLLAELV